MSIDRFCELISGIAKKIEGKELNSALSDYLNSNWPNGGETFIEMAKLCALGEKEGWLLGREAGGVKFGRAIKPGAQAGTFSVDVVRMKNIRGPHHIHPKGEIGAVFAVEGEPRFDDFQEGWYVYAPQTDHHPTISGGDAYVLYMLPEGSIEFTGKP